MIADDDKKAAGQFAWQYGGGESDRCSLAHSAFLAGVAHARKPHVVADGDLPKLGSDRKEVGTGPYSLLLYGIHSKDRDRYDNKKMLVPPHEKFFVGGYVDKPDFGFHCSDGWVRCEIKYWWPLPETQGGK